MLANLSRDIIAQLETVLCPEEGDGTIEDTCRGDRDAMSLSEKIMMWINKAGEGDTTNTYRGDLFQGVTDDEQDDISERVDLSAYRRMVLHSPAYEWFLASMKREWFLQQASMGENTVPEDICRRLLGEFPTGVISKRRAPTSYEVEFELEWCRGRASRLQGAIWISGSPVSSLSRPTEFTTVVGSREEAQVVNIKQYLNLMWPVNGRHLLGLLQTLLRLPDSRHSGKFIRREQEHLPS